MKFITYFDFLGFGDFIRNNDLEEQKKIMNDIFIGIESALSPGQNMEVKNGYTANLTEIKLNCINFSDTIIFWSNDISIESLKDIMDITYNFNGVQSTYRQSHSKFLDIAQH